MKPYGQRFNSCEQRDYTIGKLLGRGAYAKVYVGTTIESVGKKKKVAVKLFNTHKAATSSMFNEVSTLQYLIDHPCVLSLKDVIFDENRWALIFNLCKGGDLLRYSLTNGTVSEFQASSFVMDIASALAYAHTRRVCHRDVKLENVFFADRKKTRLVLGDWGFSVRFKPGKQTLNQACGSLFYASPEVLSNRPYEGPEVDCWALGVFAYGLISGTFPFSGSSPRHVLFDIRSANQGDIFPPSLADRCSDNFKRLIISLFEVNPSRRATALQVIESPWMRALQPQRVEMEMNLLLKRNTGPPINTLASTSSFLASASRMAAASSSTSTCSLRNPPQRGTVSLASESLPKVNFMTPDVLYENRSLKKRSKRSSSTIETRFPFTMQMDEPPLSLFDQTSKPFPFTMQMDVPPLSLSDQTRKNDTDGETSTSNSSCSSFYDTFSQYDQQHPFLDDFLVSLPAIQEHPTVSNSGKNLFSASTSSSSIEASSSISSVTHPSASRSPSTPSMRRKLKKIQRDRPKPPILMAVTPSKLLNEEHRQRCSDYAQKLAQKKKPKKKTRKKKKRLVARRRLMKTRRKRCNSSSPATQKKEVSPASKITRRSSRRRRTASDGHKQRSSLLPDQPVASSDQTSLQKQQRHQTANKGGAKQRRNTSDERRSMSDRNPQSMASSSQQNSRRTSKSDISVGFRSTDTPLDHSSQATNNQSKKKSPKKKSPKKKRQNKI